jgi:ribonucleoside-diphosphate reductase beta chain
MPDIFGSRKTLTPYDFPKYVEYHNRVLMSPWSHFEVSMDGDISFWENYATPTEKRIISSLFKAFTLAEGGVGEYWRDVASKIFSLPEIIDLATTFSHQETIHKRAYAHQEQSLGIDTTQNFLSDPIANKKLEYIVNNPILTEACRTTKIRKIALSLATFSGGIEGISLFTSFAILLWFCRSGKLTSSFQILSWSALDEELHSKVGIELFNDVVTQYPDHRPTQGEIEEPIRIIVQNEENFLRNAFQGEILDGIDETTAIDFLHHRANRKLRELGYSPIYDVTEKFRVLSDYFYTSIMGDLDTDFFAFSRNGQGYSAMIKQDFTRPQLEKYQHLL